MKRKYLVKVGNNFIQKSETFDTFVIGLQFNVELAEVGYGCKHYACIITLFVVQVLQDNKFQSKFKTRLYPSQCA